MKTNYLSPGCKQAVAQRRAARRRMCEEYNEPNPHKATLLWLEDLKKRIAAAKSAKEAGLPNPNL